MPVVFPVHVFDDACGVCNGGVDGSSDGDSSLRSGPIFIVGIFNFVDFCRGIGGVYLHFVALIRGENVNLPPVVALFQILCDDHPTVVAFCCYLLHCDAAGQGGILGGTGLRLGLRRGFLLCLFAGGWRSRRRLSLYGALGGGG